MSGATTASASSRHRPAPSPVGSSTIAPGSGSPSDPAGATGSTRPTLADRPSASRRFLGVRLPLLLWLELVAASVLVAVVRRDETIAAAALLVLGTAVLGLGTRAGVRLHRLVVVRWHYALRVARHGARIRGNRRGRRAREPEGATGTRGSQGSGGGRRGRRRRAQGAPDDVREAAVAALLPRLHVDSAPLRGERRFGVCFDGTGWVAVLEVEPPPQMLVAVRSSRSVPLRRLATLLRIDDIPLTSVQMLVHTVPTPVGWLPDNALAVASYRRIRPISVAAVRQTWIVLRLDADLGRDAVEARGGGVRGAHRALKRATGRALELLDAAGLAVQALDAAALEDAITLNLLGEPDPKVPADGPAPVESWSRWQAAGNAHVTWWVDGWPDDPDPVDPLVQLIQRVQAGFGTVSLTLHSAAGDAPRARLLVRACTASGGADALVPALETAATATGVTLRRLDGEQALGVLATLPLGGGVR